MENGNLHVILSIPNIKFKCNFNYYLEEWYLSGDKSI